MYSEFYFFVQGELVGLTMYAYFAEGTGTA